jgi:hypothetical protein
VDGPIIPLPSPDKPEPAPLAEVHRLPRKRRALVESVRLAAAVLAVLALLLFAADRLTASPAICGSCHEMSAREAAWKVSPHANVPCVSCHVAQHPWYKLPQTLFERVRLIGGFTAKHVATGGSVGTVDSRPAGVAPMSDAVCRQCHDPNRKPTAGLGIIIDHPKHAKRNGSCVSCHVTVAHPSPSRGTALSFMAQCFTCHGMAKSAKAPATCGICHPKDFQLLPASHGSAQWKLGHGKVALADRGQCEMCHVRSFCDRCHGLEMPHPKDWATRTGHPVYAQRERQVCARCHDSKPDWCTMCHHRAYSPGKGTWVQQHFLEVKAKGASFCLESCHSPVYCANCHVGTPTSQTAASSGGQ